MSNPWAQKVATGANRFVRIASWSDDENCKWLLSSQTTFVIIQITMPRTIRVEKMNSDVNTRIITIWWIIDLTLHLKADSELLNFFHRSLERKSCLSISRTNLAMIQIHICCSCSLTWFSMVHAEMESKHMTCSKLWSIVHDNPSDQASRPATQWIECYWPTSEPMYSCIVIWFEKCCSGRSVSPPIRTFSSSQRVCDQRWSFTSW